MMQSMMMMQNTSGAAAYTETSVMEGVNTSKDNSMIATFIEPQSALMQFYHDQVMKGRAVKFEEIQRISDLINSLLSKAGI